MFNQRLIQLRKERKLTQSDLSRILGISRSALSLYETNKRQPDFEMLCRFADFFHVSVDYLLGRTDNRHEVVYEKNCKPLGSTTDIMKDPDIQQVLSELRNMTPEEKQSLLTHLYGIKSRRQKNRDDR